ncbi:MAG TPA: nicotinate (nicotinamide) nucleotide adenylyltransferase [Chitinophagales bacterium]|nr:nicotinate (nicotinamide) nucleotide adenylyltransferase [Chitinophagales bacterium]
MKIGLFFGSFNPVHNGHLIIANYICETTDLDKVWLVVSPQNPLKSKETLLRDYDRLHLINLALEYSQNLSASNIEFKLPKPSYTIDTLIYLKEKHPEHQFTLIMGSDNLATLHKWKNYEMLLRDYEIYVYLRRGFESNPYPENTNIHLLDFPYLDISATFIRENIKRGISMQYFLPDAVWKYINDLNWYKK